MKFFLSLIFVMSISYSFSSSPIASGNDVSLDISSEIGESCSQTTTQAEYCTTSKNMLHVTMEQQQTIQIPDLLSPNGDGHNDIWLITGLYDFPSVNISVYDINGSLIHQHAGKYTPEDAWDGTRDNNGEELPKGNYFYHIKPEGANNQTFRGVITLMY